MLKIPTKEMKMITPKDLKISVYYSSQKDIRDFFMSYDTMAEAWDECPSAEWMLRILGMFPPFKEEEEDKEWRIIDRNPAHLPERSKQVNDKLREFAMWLVTGLISFPKRNRTMMNLISTSKYDAFQATARALEAAEDYLSGKTGREEVELALNKSYELNEDKFEEEEDINPVIRMASRVIEAALANDEEVTDAVWEAVILADSLIFRPDWLSSSGSLLRDDARRMQSDKLHSMIANPFK